VFIVFPDARVAAHGAELRREKSYEQGRPRPTHGIRVTPSCDLDVPRIHTMPFELI
jgi:hypothetical protein